MNEHNDGNFDARVAFALDLLMPAWENVGHMATVDLSFLDEKRKRFQAYKEKLGPEGQRFIDNYLEKSTQDTTETSQSVMRILWDSVIESTRVICGSDAVDAALTIIENQNKAN